MLLTFTALLGGPGRAIADTVRCGSGVIQEGMPASEIQLKCGNPDVVKTRREPIMARRPNGTTFQSGTTSRDFWYYDRGPDQFVMRVTVEDSVAIEVKLLEVRAIDTLDLEQE